MKETNRLHRETKALREEARKRNLEYHEKYIKPKRDAWEAEQRNLLPVRLAMTSRKFLSGGAVHRVLTQYIPLGAPKLLSFESLRGNDFHAWDIQQCLMWGFMNRYDAHTGYYLTVTGAKVLELLGEFKPYERYHDKTGSHVVNPRHQVVCPVQPSQQWLEYFTTHRW